MKPGLVSWLCLALSLAGAVAAYCHQRRTGVSVLIEEAQRLIVLLVANMLPAELPHICLRSKPSLSSFSVGCKRHHCSPVSCGSNVYLRRW